MEKKKATPKPKKVVPAVKKVVPTVNDFITGKNIPKDKAAKTIEGWTYAKDCVNTPQGILSKKSMNVVRDCVDKKYIHKRRATYVAYGGIVSNLKAGYTTEVDSLVPIKESNGRTRNSTLPSYAVSKPVALEIGFIESLFDGLFYNPATFSPSILPIPYKAFRQPFFGNNKITKIKYGAYSPSFKITEGKKYSFGVELETSAGYVPDYIRKDLNMSCVYDGSILDDNGNKRVGGEYVTGVLSGDFGFRHLYKITNELSKRCSINNTCSVHVHVGGVDFNKEMIVMLWKLNQMIETELFAMMPPSRKSREHCKKMTHLKLDFGKTNTTYKMLIDTYFDKIFNIISLGNKPSRTVNKKFNHPAGHSCGYNTSTPRYWWLNFVPAMFNLKGPENYTIEFRNHSATLNFTKIKNWILIVMGIVYVAENHQKIIASNDTMTIKRVLKLAYPAKWKYLSDYVDSRKELFSGTTPNSMNEKIEYVVKRELGSSDKTLYQTICA